MGLEFPQDHRNARFPPFKIFTTSTYFLPLKKLCMMERILRKREMGRGGSSQPTALTISLKGCSSVGEPCPQDRGTPWIPCS